MLRDTLKLEIDQLSEEQLSKLAKLIEEIKAQSNPTLTGEESATQHLQRFRDWTNSRPHTDISLPDEAFDRESIYD